MLALLVVLLVAVTVMSSLLCSSYQKNSALKMQLDDVNEIVRENLLCINFGCTSWAIPFVPNTNRKKVVWLNGNQAAIEPSIVDADRAKEMATAINACIAEEMDSLGI